MSEEKQEAQKPEFNASINLTNLVQIVTLLSVLGTWLIGLNRMENQLLIWMQDAENERAKNHESVVKLVEKVNGLYYRIENIEKYLEDDPNFKRPVMPYHKGHAQVQQYN